MDQVKIGKFITSSRKEKKLTQAQLAEMLNITDRAVSKWETGKSMPDSSIMTELCRILDISVSELLSGAKTDNEGLEEKADENLIDIQKKEKNNISKNIFITIIFSVIIFIGTIACAVIDFGVNKELTWSAIPILSIVLVWAVCIPITMMGKKGVLISFASLNVFIIPFLFLLAGFLRKWAIFTIGSVMAGVAVIFVWILAALYKRIGKKRIFIYLGVTFLLLIVFDFLINIILSYLLLELTLNLWDMLAAFILFILAFVCFLCDYAKRKGMMK